MDVAAAYRHCEEVTWSQARNFSYGIRLLPPEKRSALAAVYAFARRIDDIGDGTLPPADKLSALGEARAGIMAVAHGGSPASPGTEMDGSADLVLVALADAGRRFPIPLEAFGELIDGCEADVRGTTYTTFDDLRVYCRCVAGSIGRLSLGVFGTRDVAMAAPLADALGVALQLTNILRDIREDYQDGRVYLPDEDFKRFGAELPPDGSGWPAAAADQKLVDLVAFEAERARDWYARGLRLMPMLDRRSAACTGAMAGIYYRLLQTIAAAPQLVLQRRVSLSPGQKAMVAVRSLAGATLRSGRSGPPRPTTTAGAPR
jgi:15-cis-phytoene synthase